MRLLGIGDNVVDRYPDLGLMFPGGNAVNVAVYARRAGAEAGYWGSVGDDPAGELVRRALIDEGVDVSRVRSCAGPNAWAEVGLTDGDRVFKGSDDGVSVFTLETGDFEKLAAYDVAHSAYSGSLIGQVPQVAARTKVSFDFSHHWSQPWAEGLLPHLFLAVFSASRLSESETTGLLSRASARGVRWALATRGSAGAVLTDGNTTWREPSVRVDALDTLGAGDAFTGTLLTTLVAGGDPQTGLAAAARAAATACMAHGGFGHGALIPPDSVEDRHPAVGQLRAAQRRQEHHTGQPRTGQPGQVGNS